jgi:hypothetical protein
MRPLVLQLALAGFATIVAAQHPEHPPASPEPPPRDTDRPAHRHSGQDGAAVGSASGLFGDYPASREASGTSWQPEAAPMHGRHGMLGAWSAGGHAFLNAIYDEQGGPRGDDEHFATSMAMAMAQRELGGGRLGLRGMLSLDPWLVGRRGYPLLFQTGETPDGETPLIDRQHPHDLLMEVAATYSRRVGDRGSWFVYAALPGEPALGPPTFMHRFSGVDNAEAPLGHHWLDSTHIAFGVVTGGWVLGRFKLDASAFNGREPDEDRTDVEVRALDSESVRLTFNPSPAWSIQVGRGWLAEPEQLEPGVDAERTTASVLYHRRIANGDWQTGLAWGENSKDPGRTTHAWLLDSALRWSAERHTVFLRGEHVTKDELFREGEPFHGRAFEIVKAALGYLHRFPAADSTRWGIGTQGAVHFVPTALASVYGGDPTSWLVFVRLETH